MSLRVWLPLTKDLRQQGLDNVTVTNNGATFNSEGKLGGCYSFDGVDDAITIGNLSTLVTDNFSFVCWFYHDDTWSSKNYETIFGGPSGFELETKSGSTNSPVIRAYSWGQGTFTYELNKWNHLVMTRTTSETKFYLNGELKLTGTAGTIPSGNYFIGSWNSTTGQNFKGKVNDVRIYDHCLSSMEVKELSKGLVLHYPLSDRFLEGTTNLVTSITSGGQTTWANNILTTSGTNADTYFTLNLSENIVNGTQYTISCDAEDIPQGTCWTFPLGQQSNTTLSFQIYNGHNEYTFTANNISWGANRCFMDDGGSPNSARATGAQCKIYNFQIEKKDHATGFAGYGGTRNSNIVYDCSGLCNNGTTIGTLNILNDTPKYQASTKIAAASTGIKTPNFYVGDIWSMSVWFKYPSQDNSGWKALVILNNNGGDADLQFGNYINCSSNTIQYSANGKYTTGVTFTYGEWHHIVNTYDGTTLKCYLDGVYKTSVTPGQTLSRSNLGIGFKSSAVDFSSIGNSFTNGFLSDVRVYATALSADDVKSLYQNSAYIDSSGNVYGAVH